MPPCIQLLWDAATCNIDHSLRSELRSHAAQAPLKTCRPLCASTAPSSSATEPYPRGTFSFLGDVLCAEVGCAIADGHMDPSTLVSRTQWSHTILLCYAMPCSAITFTGIYPEEMKWRQSRTPSSLLSTHARTQPLTYTHAMSLHTVIRARTHIAIFRLA
jgi:hypothetical protein